MKLIIKQNILMESLNHVIKGVSSKNLIPVLNCIKFDLKEEGLYLMSTDNDISIQSFIPATLIEKIEEVGTIVISGRYIYDIVKKLPNEAINVEEVIDSRVNIYTKNSSFYLNCHNKEEFPNLSMEEVKSPVKISKNLFKKVLRQVLFATSMQESRPSLTGLNMKIEGNKMECIATDSYRLAKKELVLDEVTAENINIIVPSKNLAEIGKIMDDSMDQIELHIFNNKIIFKFDHLIILSRLINATYPDVTSKLPSVFGTTIKMKLNEFYDAIDRASLLTNEHEKNTIKLETLQDEIRISSTIPEIGKVDETVSALIQNEGDFKVSFSSKYMIDCIRSIDGDEIELLFPGENVAFLIKDPTDETLLHLVSPIKSY